jgi:hypothetical protein
METGRTIGTFIFKEILCRWGTVEEIMTDNGSTYVAAMDWLTSRYDIHHICISAYNSQANGIIERQHHTICDSLVKVSHSICYFLFLFLLCLAYGLLGPYGPDSDCAAYAHMTYVYALTTVLVVLTRLLCF